MPVNLISSGGGTTTLTPAASASNFTVTLPAATGTMALTSSVVSSLNGQTGAITNTDLGTIGSYVFTYPNSGTFSVGQTTAGSNLYTAGSALTGTWRFTGMANFSSFNTWVRIS